MSNFCSHVWYGNSLALNEPSFLHYSQLIEQVKPGDIIEVYRRTHSVWAVYDKVDNEGHHWCYCVVVEDKEVSENQSSVEATIPGDYYTNCREFVSNCAPCSWEKTRKAQVWSRLARPSLTHKCCQKDMDPLSHLNCKVAFVRHTQVIDVLKQTSGKPDILYNDGLFFARINNQEILAEKFGLVSHDANMILDELSSSWLDKQVPYNTVTLNSEHYVTAWKYGSSWCNDGSDSWDSVGLDTGSAAIVRVLHGVGTAFENLATMVGNASNGGHNDSVDAVPEVGRATASFSPQLFYTIQQKLKCV